MLSLDDGSEVSEFVEESVLEWVKLYPSFENTQDVCELTDGRLFIKLLETLPNFKLQESIEEPFDELNLASRVSRIKSITKSLLEYHQIILFRDMEDFDINSVELCMGNKKELLRLIVLVFSALQSHPPCSESLLSSLQSLSPQSHQVLKIMLEYCQQIDNPNVCPSGRSLKFSERKNITLKIEFLENRIEELEEGNRKLEEIVSNLKEGEDALVEENNQLKIQIKNLIATNETLSFEIEKTSNDLKRSTLEESATKKKMEMVKSKLKERINFLEEEVESLQEKITSSENLKLKLQELKEINLEIKNQNESLREENCQLIEEKNNLKRESKKHSEEILELKQQCCELEIKVEELSIACSYKSNDRSESSKTCCFGRGLSEEEEREYRVREDLRWYKEENYMTNEAENNLQVNSSLPVSYSPRSPENYWNNATPSRAPGHLFSIRTITERSVEESQSQLQEFQHGEGNLSKCQEFVEKEYLSKENEHNSKMYLQNSKGNFTQNREKSNENEEKENNSLMLNVDRPRNETSENKREKGKANGKCDQNFSQEKNIENEESGLSPLEKSLVEEIRLLTAVVIDLQGRLEEAEKKNALFVDNNSLTKSRMQEFTKKVQKMFNNDEGHQKNSGLKK